MTHNRFSYASLGAGFPYVSVRFAFEATHNTYIELQGLTDGGGVWKDQCIHALQIGLKYAIPANC